MLVVQDHIRGVAQAPRQVDQRAMSKLMDLEDTIIDVGDAIDVILKDIDAEGVTEACGGVRGDSGPGHTLQDSGRQGSQVPLTQTSQSKLSSTCSSCCGHYWQKVPSALDVWGQGQLLLPLLTLAEFLLLPILPPRSSILFGRMNEWKSGPEGQGEPQACRTGAGGVWLGGA